jgi:ribosomal protein L11 methyltransferase
MKWKKIRIKTITEAEDIIVSTLYDIGLEGAQIEDKVPLTALEKEQMFVDIMPEGEEDDGVAYLSFFVEEAEDGRLLLPWTEAIERMASAGGEAEAETKTPSGDGAETKENTSVRTGEERMTEVLEDAFGVEKVYVREEAVLECVKKELAAIRQFMDIGEGTVAVDETEDIDWINNWKQYFHQFTIDDLLVIPSWEEVKPEDAEKKILHIDPGTAFGTGMHETTQLCIRQIKKYLTSETVLLDVGTGSGILGIISLMYGGKRVVGTDLDPCAVPAVKENLEANQIPAESFEMMIGNIITDQTVQEKVGYGCYDIVAANILADVLLPLTPVILNQLKPGGIYITSGIIDDKEEVVRKAVEDAGLTILEVTYQGEWVSVTAQKP